MVEAKDAQGKQYVVFRLGNEDYALDIHSVTTIEKPMIVARVPRTPHFIKGVINLRGEIVPVMELSIRFNLTPAPESEETRIVIVKVGEASLGLVVDEVEDVLYLSKDSIENVSNYSTDLSMDFITGVGKVNDRVITILNLEKLIEFNESGS
ncbi:MAG: chemotaxis protein CheW [Clostridiaceae bacterium]|mgnify:CR=1 FL=1|nr:chemotaxis protein CheW [Clostridiaceae bacterium]